MSEEWALWLSFMIGIGVGLTIVGLVIWWNRLPR